MGVAIIDSGGANVASLQCALARLECQADLTRDPVAIRAASHVLLPGVGAAADAMQRLSSAGLAEIIPTLKQPVLGICLGMQLLFSGSGEGQVQCLGLIDGFVNSLEYAPGRPVPHMGWNTVQPEPQCRLFAGIDAGTHFYFVHSYAAEQGASTIATCSYGETFSAAVRSDNFYGTQFHPERSGQAGARLLSNFLELDA